MCAVLREDLEEMAANSKGRFQLYVCLSLLLYGGVLTMSSTA